MISARSHKSPDEYQKSRVPARNRSALLIHALYVSIIPAVVVVILYLLLDSNSAEFRSLFLGFKLGGPIAAYAALLMLFDKFATNILVAWSEDDPRAINTDEAMRLAGLFADLIARFFLVEILLGFRREYDISHYETIVSIARKNAYGFSKIVGNVTIANGKYQLSDILAQSTNNDEFHTLLKAATFSVLTNLMASFGPPNKKETEEAKALQKALKKALEEGELPEGAPPGWYEIVTTAEGQVRVNTPGLTSVYGDFKNKIWKICEFGIHKPEEFFKKYHYLSP